jgi:hypothetical protein
MENVKEFLFESMDLVEKGTLTEFETRMLIGGMVMGVESSMGCLNLERNANFFRELSKELEMRYLGSVEIGE